MQTPPLRTVSRQFEQLVQGLPPQWRDGARKHRALSRARQIRNAEDLLRAVLLYCGADLSLRSVAAELTLRAGRINDEALRRRLMGCCEWVQALLGEMLRDRGEVLQRAEGLRVVSVDGTEVGKHYRLHLMIELQSLELLELELSQKKKGESLKNFLFRKGDVVVPDRGYCSYSGIFQAVFEQQVQLVIRWNHGLALHKGENEQEVLDLCKALEGQEEGSIRTFPVVVKYFDKSRKVDERKVFGWLHGYRMTEEQSKRAVRRTTKTHRRKNKPLSQRTIFLSRFVLVFTPLPPQTLSPEEALGLYRCRWQIELLIKRLKGTLELKKLRCFSEGKLAALYILGKLLYLVLLDKLMPSSFRAALSLGAAKRKLTPTRPYQLLKRAMDSSLLSMELWRKESIVQALHVLCERPRRKRRLQTLPLRVREFKERIAFCLNAA